MHTYLYTFVYSYMYSTGNFLSNDEDELRNQLLHICMHMHTSNSPSKHPESLGMVATLQPYA